MIESEIIPPAGLDARNFYPFFVPLELTRTQTSEFLKDGIALSIAIRITWTDAIGTRREQAFGDFYDCTIDRMVVSEKLGKRPTFVGIEKGNEEADMVTRDVRILGDSTTKTQA